MKKRQWHSGPPPSVGWWTASALEDKRSIRWWDGVRWSMAVGTNCTAEVAARFAEIKALSQDKIKWTERWWE